LEGFDPGAVWEDQRFGWQHFFDWERCVVVTDVSWAKHLAKFSEVFGFLWPGRYRAFAEADASEARDWIAADDSETSVPQPDNPDLAQTVDAFTKWSD
jgi:hypothetical protein